VGVLSTRDTQEEHVKHREEIMQILEAFDLTNSYRDAGGRAVHDAGSATWRTTSARVSFLGHRGWTWAAICCHWLSAARGSLRQGLADSVPVWPAFGWG
jgi:hypothetical protein